MAHFCNPILERCITVPVRTLKLRRQSPHQYGSGLPEGTGRTFSVPPHSGQCDGFPASPQRCSSNHRSAAESSENFAISSTSEIPSR